MLGYWIKMQGDEWRPGPEIARASVVYRFDVLLERQELEAQDVTLGVHARAEAGLSKGLASFWLRRAAPPAHGSAQLHSDDDPLGLPQTSPLRPRYPRSCLDIRYRDLRAQPSLRAHPSRLLSGR